MVLPWARARREIRILPDAVRGLCGTSGKPDNAVIGLAAESEKPDNAVIGLAGKSEVNNNAVIGLAGKSEVNNNAVIGLAGKSGKPDNAVIGLAGKPGKADNAVIGLAEKSEKPDNAVIGPFAGPGPAVSSKLDLEAFVPQDLRRSRGPAAVEQQVGLRRQQQGAAVLLRAADRYQTQLEVGEPEGQPASRGLLARRRSLTGVPQSAPATAVLFGDAFRHARE